MRRILGAPARALFGRRVEIDLDVRPREDDRSDIAAFHHHPTSVAQLAL